MVFDSRNPTYPRSPEEAVRRVRQEAAMKMVLIPDGVNPKVTERRDANGHTDLQVLFEWDDSA
jgi:hypothetical protein